MARNNDAHPDDDALSSLLDDQSSAAASLRDHAADCADCTRRVHGLRETRDLIANILGQYEPAPGDIAGRAAERMRRRQRAIGSTNEVIAALRALIWGFAELWGGGARHG
ncbi:MAG: hypothetical protein GIX01_13205 [Candidatus Eremiobacteraeota bacterium]|nr:hypothetical protein [Candidatus Eremiobacteraeota bacterium]